MTEYRIDYTILRRQPGDDDFTEVGFGSSGGWGSVGEAMYDVQSAVDNRQWETSDGMPDPAEV